MYVSEKSIYVFNLNDIANFNDCFQHFRLSK